MKKVVGYVRVSTEEQAKEGVSLDAQEAKIRQYAELFDLGEVEIISDEGKSGKNLKRKGIHEVIRLVEEKKIEHLVVYKLDRLTRDLLDQLTLIKTFEAAGVKFHSLTERIDTSKAVGQLFLNVVGAINQFIRDQIAEVTIDALQFKKEKGEPLGPPALGFTAEDKKRVKNHQELETVQYVKGLRRKKLSYRDIARRLNAEQIRTKRGRTWHPSTVYYILKSKLYKGTKVGLQKKSGR